MVLLLSTHVYAAVCAPQFTVLIISWWPLFVHYFFRPKTRVVPLHRKQICSLFWFPSALQAFLLVHSMNHIIANLTESFFGGCCSIHIFCILALNFFCRPFVRYDGNFNGHACRTQSIQVMLSKALPCYYFNHIIVIYVIYIPLLLQAFTSLKCLLTKLCH